MDGSRALKRQKLIGETFNDVIDDLEKVVELRKNTETNVVTPIYLMEMKHIQKELTKIELELSQIKVYKVPNMESSFDDFQTLSKEYDKVVERIGQHVALLTILDQKKNCPIAKIIDEI